jgi:hypothetical protein
LLDDRGVGGVRFARLLVQSPARGEQMSEEDLAAEIERQRTLNAARRGFMF